MLGIVIYRKEEGFAILSLKILVPYHAGDPGLIPGSERSPGEGNGKPLQYPCLEILWTEEPGGLQSMGSQRVGHE